MGPSNVSSVVDYFSTHSEGFTTTLGSTISSGATTVPLNTTTGLTNGTIFVGIIEPGATNQQVFTGTVNTGAGTITGAVWTRGTNVGHAGGVAIVDYVTGTAFNMLTAGILKQHTQTGTHTGLTTDTMAASGNATVGGTLGVTGASTMAALALNGSLTGTGLHNQILTYSNSGSAGGTFYYANFSGIKMLWGITANQTLSGTGPINGSAVAITMPTSFFTTFQMVMSTPGNAAAGTSMLTSAIQASSTTSISVVLNQINGTNGSGGISLFVIGT